MKANLQGQERLVVRMCDNRPWRSGIRRGKRSRLPRRTTFVPLELKGREPSVGLFDIVDFALRRRAPEVAPCVGSRVCDGLASFCDEIVFPQGADVLPERDRGEVPYYGIADSVVPEIDLFSFRDLVSCVSCEGREPEHDESLFKKVDVCLYGGFVDSDGGGKLAVGYFAADLEGEALYKPHENVAFSYSAKGEDVLVECAVGNGLEDPSGIIGGGSDFGVGTPDESCFKEAGFIADARGGCREFSEGERVQPVFKNASCGRFEYALCELKRARPRSHDLRLSAYGVGEHFERQPDFRHSLRFVYHKKIGVPRKCRQRCRGWIRKQRSVIGVVAIQHDRSVDALGQLLEKCRFPDLPRTKNKDYFPLAEVGADAIFYRSFNHFHSPVKAFGAYCTTRIRQNQPEFGEYVRQIRVEFGE